MRAFYQIGDLVHIPQAVELIDYRQDLLGDPQLPIPLRVRETDHPEVGIVTQTSPHGYVRIYCNGDYWSVKSDRLYCLNGEL
jgi:hypothetical protein